MYRILITKWLARSGLFFLSCSLFGCIVIHSDSTPDDVPREKVPQEGVQQEKASSEKTLSQKEFPQQTADTKQAWNCSATAETEVIELHEFFESWYNGGIARSEENFSRLTNVLADDFQLITATGFTVNKALLVTLMKGGYGTKQDLNMRIEKISQRAQGENLCVLTYEEYGNTEGGLKKVLVSAVLRRAPEKRNGLEWLHVHEVSVPMQEQKAENENSEPEIIP